MNEKVSARLFSRLLVCSKLQSFPNLQRPSRKNLQITIFAKSPQI